MGPNCFEAVSNKKEDKNMNGMNKVVLMGRLGGNPVSSATKSGKRIATFNIATNEYYKNENGEKVKRTDWHKVVATGKTAEACEKMLNKGSFKY